MEWTVKSIMMLIVLYTLFIMVFVLLCRKQKQLSDKLLILYATVEILGIARFFVGEELFQTFPQYYFITIPICYTYIPVFYLYFLSNFKADFGLIKKQLVHFILFALYLLYYSIRYLSKPVLEVQQLIINRPKYIQVEWIAHETILNIQYIIYSALLIIAVKQIHKNKQGTKQRPFLLIVLISYLVGIALSLVLAGLTIFEVNTSIDIQFWGVMYFYAFFIFLFFITIRKIESEKIRNDHRQIFSNTKAKELEKHIYSKIKEQQLFRDQQLSLSGCAQQLNMGVKEFSYLLNHHLNENFNEYINRFRIECAKEMLINHSDRTVQEIMYDSGFNSKAVFYAAFKKQTNLSPGNFRKSHLL